MTRTPAAIRLAALALLAVLAACGGSQQGKITVHKETWLEPMRPILFTSDLELTPGSYQVLDTIAQTFVGNPSIQRVEVQVFVGEGDDDGARLELAQRRAQAIVDYLVSKQVAAERLEPQGYHWPSPDPTTQAAFIILKRESD